MAALAERRKELLDSMMKQAVYEGAVQVLTQHGLRGTTMDRVAAAAGMAKGSLYNYFRSKQDLLEFVHDRAIAPIQEAVSEVLEMQISAADKLSSIFRRWREYLVSQHAVLEFLILDQSAKRAVDLVSAGRTNSGPRRASDLFWRTAECPKWSCRIPDATLTDEGGENRAAGIPHFPQFTASVANSANWARSRFTSRISFLRL